MKKLIIIATLGMMILAISNTVRPVSAFTNHYASPTGSATNPTCPLISPCTLQHAVDIAGSGDTVYVESGTYTSKAAQVLLINKDLSLVGRCSFSGLTATCSAKNPSSILDGELERRVITITGAAGNNISVWLRFFDIAHGNATEIATLKGVGGGLNATLFESLDVTECKFYQNFAARKVGVGAIYEGHGGAMAVFGGNHINISDNQFLDNTAVNDGIGYGGAIFTGSSSPSYDLVISNNLFDSNNCSPLNGPGSQGCAIYIGSHYFDIVGNLFSNNNNLGPAYNYEGGSIFVGYTSGTDIIENTFSNENGKSVLMVDSYDPTPLDRVLRNKFLDNQVLNVIEYTGYFGARIMNNWIGQKPTSPTRDKTRSGGQTGIYMYENDNGSGSAAIYFNTFAILDYGVITDTLAGGTIQNNIFAEIYGSAITGVSSGQIIRNLFHNAFPGDSMGGTDPAWGDPLLVDPMNGDFHIAINSAAINQGTYTLSFAEINDIDNQARPFGVGATPYDLGADEFIKQTYLPILFK